MLLTGCSIFSVQQDTQGLSALTDFQVRGKLSVRTPEDSNTGYLTWQQEDNHFDLFISGPFGQGASRLTGDENSATITLPGKDPVTASSARQLMARYLGWQFPVLDLRYWVKGQASPAAKATELRDEQGLMTSLSQHGWLVEFSRYSKQGALWLPGKVKITNLSQQSQQSYRFIFVIKEWAL